MTTPRGRDISWRYPSTGHEIRLRRSRALRWSVAGLLLAGATACGGGEPPGEPPVVDAPIERVGPTVSPSTTPTPSDTPTPSRTPTPTFPVDARVRIGALNLRAGPDLLHPVLEVAGRRTPVALEGRDDTGSWFAVRLPNESRGWLSGEFLDFERDPETVPTQPTPSPPPSPTATPIPMDPALPLIAVPPQVAQGDPLLVRLRAEGARQVIAAFDGVETGLFEVRPGEFAGILSAGLETHPGGQPVYLTVVDGEGNARTEQLDIRIRSGGYPEERIVLDPERLSLLDPATGEAELDRLRAIWAPVTPEKLWQGQWILPVASSVSSDFGGFRNYNEGRLVSRHTGLDLRGPVGTEVMAPARGRVVMAEALSIRGNVVWLDHGWGIYSGYFHLSEMAVVAGDLVERGARLGAIGATGRVTAPHLHWELRVHGRAAQPLQWLLRDVGFVP